MKKHTVFTIVVLITSLMSFSAFSQTLNFDFVKNQSLKTSNTFTLKKTLSDILIVTGEFSGFDNQKNYVSIETVRINSQIDSESNFDLLSKDIPLSGDSTSIFFKIQNKNLTAISGKTIERVSKGIYTIEYDVIAISIEDFSAISNKKTDLSSVKKYRLSGELKSVFIFECFDTKVDSSDLNIEEKVQNPSWCKEYF